ncbi:MAG: NCS2 family permease [Xylanivirga thermophila]|jgi:adenine/guanine/hypoxanthine permease|uniref:NCS2 family permease n=1 Tax=Xylanivirga thermophila TaxID=2496273 RepID=UPI00101D11B8|nr:NCS2 family permease [Xylanivirga thermophila]
MEKIEKFFKLKENNTDVKTEIIAGITTFFTMAYIIFVNPDILSQTGMDFNSVMIATCISATIGTLLIGLMSNYPFAQAPGMGLNAFFTFSVVFGLGYTWQQALAAVFISGIVFLLITISGIRQTVVEAIPLSLKNAISAGIGFFIAFVGFNNAGIIHVNQGPIIDIINATDKLDKGAMIGAVNNAGSQVLEFGNFADPAVLLAVIGLVITGILMVKQVKGALFIGILATTIIGIPMGVTNLDVDFSMKSITLKETFMKMDFAGLVSGKGGVLNSIISVVTVVLSFFIVDMFDTMGTLIGTANKAGFLDKDGNLPRGNKAMLADAIATCAGAVLGTSTVTTFVESSAGVSEGGRTGLTSVVVSILFLLAIFLAPVAGIIPGAATAPALIIVGVLMMSSLKNINFDDFEEALPAFVTMVLMPYSYSIANGIAAGFIFYAIVKLVKGKAKEVHPVMYIFVGLFILRYLLLTLFM